MFDALAGLGTVKPGTLYRGSRGSHVLAVQKSLNRALKWGLAEDGIFGAKTEEAVRSYQKFVGLKVDGIVGPQTWDALVVRGVNIMPFHKPTATTYADLVEEEVRDLVIARPSKPATNQYPWQISTNKSSGVWNTMNLLPTTPTEVEMMPLMTVTGDRIYPSSNLQPGGFLSTSGVGGGGTPWMVWLLVAVGGFLMLDGGKKKSRRRRR